MSTLLSIMEELNVVVGIRILLKELGGSRIYSGRVKEMEITPDLTSGQFILHVE